jgi:tRNA threonylcarbamoyl adenosine modification protein YjeE
MLATATNSASLDITLADEAATLAFAAEFADLLRPGDIVTLSGDLGAGKTTFARALIRHLAGDATLEVPSPTFTLMQNYELSRFPLAHVDLYRLGDPSELAELGVHDVAADAVILIEWPDRAGGGLPSDRYDFALALSNFHGPNYRTARLAGYGHCAARVERMAEIHRFLNAQGYVSFNRTRIAGDASTRRYERLMHGDQTILLMDSPRRTDGPPVRDGKPYSAIAHLAEDVTPFIAMARGLRQRGFSAPRIFASDRAKGLLLLDDFGDAFIASGTPPAPVEERYEAAVDVLIALHRQILPQTLVVEGGITHTLPRYGADALLIEVELLLDWYLPRLGASVPDTIRQSYLALWADALAPALESPQTWVLRDFHSPNLMWLPQRHGIAQIGLLDFQDAVMGSPAYDLASLAQDARVDIPEMLELALLSRYVRGRRSEPDFDAANFARLYATLAAQRASKILGIFARLDRRDGKPQYLRHQPRVWGYLQRSLAHPALAPLRAWYDANVPRPGST